MNLIIDIGNTRTKIALYTNNTLHSLSAISQDQFITTLIALKSNTQNKINKSIVSNVAKLSADEKSFLDTQFDVVYLTKDTKIPFTNCYRTPQTLGVDRVALIAAASYQYKYNNALIIDAGTCITYDFKNDKNEYLGGAIAPGLSMRYKSLHVYTTNLPELEKEEHVALIGRSTKEAIHTGVSFHTALEVDAVIDQYCNKYPDLTVILTGGDAHFLSKRLKNSIFATSNFLLEGLNYILGINKDK